MKGLEDGSHSGLGRWQPLRACVVAATKASKKSHGSRGAFLFLSIASGDEHCHRKCHGIRVTIAPPCPACVTEASMWEDGTR